VTPEQIALYAACRVVAPPWVRLRSGRTPDGRPAIRASGPRETTPRVFDYYLVAPREPWPDHGVGWHKRVVEQAARQLARALG